MIYLDVWPGEGLVEVEKLVYCCPQHQGICGYSAGLPYGL